MLFLSTAMTASTTSTPSCNTPGKEEAKPKLIMGGSFEEESRDSPCPPPVDDEGERRGAPVEDPQATLGAGGDLDEVLTDVPSMNLFSRKQKKGFIDVWWLFDDGGRMRITNTLSLP